MLGNTLRLFKDYSHSSSMLSSKNNRTYSKKISKITSISVFTRIQNHNESKDENEKYRYDINRPKSRRRHKYSKYKYKKCLTMKMLIIYIKQHPRIIWSSIQEKIKQRWDWKKALFIKTSMYCGDSLNLFGCSYCPAIFSVIMFFVRKAGGERGGWGGRGRYDLIICFLCKDKILWWCYVVFFQRSNFIFHISSTKFYFAVFRFSSSVFDNDEVLKWCVIC